MLSDHIKVLAVCYFLQYEKDKLRNIVVFCQCAQAGAKFLTLQKCYRSSKMCTCTHIDFPLIGALPISAESSGGDAGFTRA